MACHIDDTEEDERAGRERAEVEIKVEGDLGAQTADPHPVSGADDEEEKDTPRRSAWEGCVCVAR